MRDDERRPPDTLTLLDIEIPAIAPPTPHEIARRRAVFARVMALREQMPLLGVASDELIHLARAETDADV